MNYQRLVLKAANGGFGGGKCVFVAPTAAPIAVSNIRDKWRKYFVVPAKAGIQRRSTKVTGFPPSRGRRIGVERSHEIWKRQ